MERFWPIPKPSQILFWLNRARECPPTPNARIGERSTGPFAISILDPALGEGDDFLRAANFPRLSASPRPPGTVRFFPCRIAPIRPKAGIWEAGDDPDGRRRGTDRFSESQPISVRYRLYGMADAVSRRRRQSVHCLCRAGADQ